MKTYSQQQSDWQQGQMKKVVIFLSRYKHTDQTSSSRRKTHLPWHSKTSAIPLREPLPFPKTGLQHKDKQFDFKHVEEQVTVQ